MKWKDMGILLVKDPNMKRLSAVWFPTVWHSGKWKTMGRVVRLPGLVRRQTWISRVQRIFKAERLLCIILQWWLMSKPIKCTTAGWTLTWNMYIGWLWCVSVDFISYNKCTILVGDITCGVAGSCVCVLGIYGEIPVSSAQCYCEPKVSLKKKKKFCLKKERNELLSHEKTRNKLKCILLCERSQSGNPAHQMIPTTWHAGKGKAVEAVKGSVVTRG